MKQQHIFQVWKGDTMKASCHSTEREEARLAALELADEVGNCVVKDENRIWWEKAAKDCPWKCQWESKKPCLCRQHAKLSREEAKALLESNGFVISNGDHS